MLGFRNFRDSNLALLGKQGWRFLTKPESLVSKVFKARYFPSGNFLSAKLRNYPSFVWRSVLEAKQVVQASVRWIVGNGKDIDIPGQPWLEDNLNPYVTSTSEALNNTKVLSLLTLDHSSLDLEILSDLFNARDQDCINRIPVRDNSEDDKVYWSKEASSIYSVKSAYRLLQAQKGLWSTANHSSLWKKGMVLKSSLKSVEFTTASCIRLSTHFCYASAKTR